MITIFVRDYNSFSQDFYDSIVFSLQFHQLTCSCGRSACLTIHGYYFRSVKTPHGVIRLRVCRVKCSECGKTHAILLSVIVPYSQILLEDQQQVILLYEQGKDPYQVCSGNVFIDENNVKSVLRSYRRFWREKLRAERIPLTPLRSLVRMCFSLYLAQFMQIHRTVNSLFSIPT